MRETDNTFVLSQPSLDARRAVVAGVRCADRGGRGRSLRLHLPLCLRGPRRSTSFLACTHSLRVQQAHRDWTVFSRLGVSDDACPLSMVVVSLPWLLLTVCAWGQYLDDVHTPRVCMWRCSTLGTCMGARRRKDRLIPYHGLCARWS